MIDLTPLDVRNKRGDFKKIMRGYDPHDVDIFLELAAERLESLVRENMQLRERTQSLQEQVASQAGREHAVHEALVTAQELRADIRAQSQREADHIVKEAEAEARRRIAEADAEIRTKLRGTERQADQARDALVEMERRRGRFVKEFRMLLERELDVVRVEEGREPLDGRAIDLDLGPQRTVAGGRAPAESEESEPPEDANASTADGPDDAEEAVDVSSLSPVEPVRAQAPPPAVGHEPSSLEVELMAGATGASAPSGRRRPAEVEPFAGVPDLETVLAEAGADEPQRPKGDGIEPPPIRGRTDDNLILFDPDEKDHRR
ncbi:MAG: DivIVA domain-containing protein [Gemmatimonadetes bacterium]|nr:DivIVA domain-containing protein [Gemmatimonadota bacterium]